MWFSVSVHLLATTHVITVVKILWTHEAAVVKICSGLTRCTLVSPLQILTTVTMSIINKSTDHTQLICFFTPISTSKKMLFSECKL